jgi:hypothetical protein
MFSPCEDAPPTRLLRLIISALDLTVLFRRFPSTLIYPPTSTSTEFHASFHQKDDSHVRDGVRLYTVLPYTMKEGAGSRSVSTTLPSYPVTALLQSFRCITSEGLRSLW